MVLVKSLPSTIQPWWLCISVVVHVHSMNNSSVVWCEIERFCKCESEYGVSFIAFLPGVLITDVTITSC